MSIQIQLRRGTAVQHETFTGSLAELTVDTTNNVVKLHNGSTAGGIELLRKDLNNLSSGAVTNAKLEFSSTTIGTTSIALGASSTTLAGLTSVTSTAFVGALTGNATTATTLATARTISGTSFDGSANITLSTTGITEGTNLYFTDSRALAANTAAITTAVSTAAADATSKVAAEATARDAAIAAAVALKDNTDEITEGSTNLYFTTARARNSVSASTGIAYDNTTGVISTSNIPNASLTNSSLTVGTTSIALGASSTTLAGLTSVTSTSFTGTLTGNASTATALQTPRTINGVSFDGSSNITITSTATNALTIGTGLSGTSYNGSGDVTIAIDSTVATLTATQTLTNKTLTSPTIGTSIVSASASLDVFNTTATAVNAFGAASTIALGKDGNTVTTLQGKLTTVGVYGTTHLTTYASLFLNGTSTNNVVQASSSNLVGGIGLWSPGFGGTVYSSGNLVLRVGATLRDQDVPTGGTNAVTITTGTGAVSLANNLTVAGDTVLTGNLTVNGTTTTINSTVTSVDDIEFELGSVATPTDVTANGGGIRLKGTTDKTINWSSIGWTSSEDFNLVTGKSFGIDGTSVLSATTLGSGVTGSSLTSVGTITTGTWSGLFGAVSGANLTSLTAGNLTGTISAARLPAFTGDATTPAGESVLTLATVNSNVGAFGSATAIPVITVNAKGLVTAVSTTAVSIPSGALTFTGDVTGSGTTGGSTALTISAGAVTSAMLAGSIADTKLSTISTAGKVSNSATTATNLNTASSIVSRDASGDFTAGIITASSIILPGSTSGTAKIIPAAIAGTNTVLTLPTASGIIALTGYPTSTTSLPNGDFGSGETYVGQNTSSDAFGVAMLATYTLMEPVGSIAALDLNV